MQQKRSPLAGRASRAPLALFLLLALVALVPNSLALRERAGERVSAAAADWTIVADGLATKLYVMGPERGLEWIDGRPDCAALFIVRTGPDEFKLVPSARFPEFQALP